MPSLSSPRLLLFVDSLNVSQKNTDLNCAMSADAASLPCPVCSHTGVFESVQSLRNRLISVSTNKIKCPVCQEEVCGLDKLTIHLFTHVKLPSKLKTEKCETKSNEALTCKAKSEIQCVKQPKKPRPSSSSKNKPPPSTSSSSSTPVKYVKIYPKLPVISLNTVPVINLPQGNATNECVKSSKPIYVPTVQGDVPFAQKNTTCDVCGLQFVNVNILKMHKCIIHNINNESNETFTRYDCHLCPKNFKMRGSLMVHLRVAHYGFSSTAKNNTENTPASGDKNLDQISEDKPVNFDRNDSKQWQCDVCRKCFTTKYFLKKHKRLHTGETPYACVQCNKTFTFQQSYHKHLLYHNDEKPHICNYCGRAFKELSTLHNHQRIHTGEKPFTCETCGKCFRQRVSYLVHRRIHTGVMPYKCTACDKSFRYKVSQRTHKCQAQPPGTVIRQAGDLVEKLKKKHSSPKSSSTNSEVQETGAKLTGVEISEENVELALRGAKISLEDMESECFSIITESFSESNNGHPTTGETRETLVSQPPEHDIFGSNIEQFIDSIPIDDKNVPSPSEILKNLCLSKEDDYLNVMQDNKDKKNEDNMSKEFNIFF